MGRVEEECSPGLQLAAPAAQGTSRYQVSTISSHYQTQEQTILMLFRKGSQEPVDLCPVGESWCVDSLGATAESTNLFLCVWGLEEPQLSFSP